MFVLLNGAFGIGKTTAAAAWAAQRAATAIHDPEPLGIAIQRVSSWLGARRRIADFQDVAAWRRSAILGARWKHRRARTVIVPMAVSTLGYVEELADGLGIVAPVTRICLVAPLAVVQGRLRQRAQAEGTAMDGWAWRRAEECCRAHASGAFGHPVDATGSTADVVRALTLLVDAPSPLIRSARSP